jgi:uncharacterized protein YciI
MQTMPARAVATAVTGDGRVAPKAVAILEYRCTPICVASVRDNRQVASYATDSIDRPVAKLGYLSREPRTMPFFVICLDRPDTAEKRSEMRLAHLEYVDRHLKRFLFGGPLLADHGDLRTGMVFMLNFQTRAQAEAFMAEEPYTKSGVFESVVIRRFLQVFPEQQPGYFSDFLRAERDRASSTK